IPAEDEALRNLVSGHGKVDSLMADLKLFEFVRPLLQTATALDLAAYDRVRQAASEKVIYREVRCAPELSTDHDLTIVE
ncbi:adenosine deaminase, partial [Streptococcus suis]